MIKRPMSNQQQTHKETNRRMIKIDCAQHKVIHIESASENERILRVSYTIRNDSRIRGQTRVEEVKSCVYFWVLKIERKTEIKHLDFLSLGGA